MSVYHILNREIATAFKHTKKMLFYQSNQEHAALTSKIYLKRVPVALVTVSLNFIKYVFNSFEIGQLLAVFAGIYIYCIIIYCIINYQHIN